MLMKVMRRFGAQCSLNPPSKFAPYINHFMKMMKMRNTIWGKNSRMMEWYCRWLTLFHTLRSTPKDMWITPKIREIFILYPFRKDIEFEAVSQTGSTPKG